MRLKLVSRHKVLKIKQVPARMKCSKRKRKRKRPVTTIIQHLQLSGQICLKSKLLMKLHMTGGDWGFLTRLLNDSELEHLVLGVSAAKSVEEADI